VYVDGGNQVIIDDDVPRKVSEYHKVWKCKGCESENPSTVEQCISCLTFRNAETAKEDIDKERTVKRDEEAVRTCDSEVVYLEDMWICRRCTLENPISCDRCGVCEAPQLINMPQQAMEKHKNAVKSPSTANKKIDESKTSTKENSVDTSETNGEAGVWICAYCTYNNNPSWANICDVCQSVKQAYVSPSKMSSQQKSDRENGDRTNSWKCIKCNVLNTNSVRDCASCGSLRAPVSTVTHCITTEPKHEMWACARCTLMNSELAHVCAACLAKRKSVLPSVNELSIRSGCWSCPSCTFVNDADRSKCHACNGNKSKQSSADGASYAKKKVERLFGLERQNSIVAEERHAKEETRARDQWMQIVNYCKAVSLSQFSLKIICNVLQWQSHAWQVK